MHNTIKTCSIAVCFQTIHLGNNPNNAWPLPKDHSPEIELPTHDESLKADEVHERRYERSNYN